MELAGFWAFAIVGFLVIFKLIIDLHGNLARVEQKLDMLIAYFSKE